MWVYSGGGVVINLENVTGLYKAEFEGWFKGEDIFDYYVFLCVLMGMKELLCVVELMMEYCVVGLFDLDDDFIIYWGRFEEGASLMFIGFEWFVYKCVLGGGYY